MSPRPLDLLHLQDEVLRFLANNLKDFLMNWTFEGTVVAAELNPDGLVGPPLTGYDDNWSLIHDGCNHCPAFGKGLRSAHQPWRPSLADDHN